MMNVGRTMCVCVVGLVLGLSSAVGCSKSGAASPASPTAVGGSSAVSPGVGYDATGTWFFKTTSAKFEDLNDNGFETFVTQQANGMLSFLDEDGVPVTLERLPQGDGAVWVYRLFNVGPEDGSDCDLRAKGTVRLDAATDTIIAPFRLKSLCTPFSVGGVITGTKLN